VLTQWLLEIATSFKQLPETFVLTCYILVRYFSTLTTVDKKDYQAIGIASLWIANKTEEYSILDMINLLKLSPELTQYSILMYEKEILKALDYYVQHGEKQILDEISIFLEDEQDQIKALSMLEMMLMDIKTFWYSYKEIAHKIIHEVKK